jgi:hypothetical protein
MIIPDYKIHINYSTDKASDGTTIRSSIMVNIYEEKVEAAVKLYRELKAQIEGDQTVPLKSGNGRVDSFPECPDHKVKMVMRTRRSDGGVFFGCPMYESLGCQKTAQYPINQKKTVKIY